MSVGLLRECVANARTVDLASHAALIVLAAGVGSGFMSIGPVGGNNSTSYIVPMPLPYRKGLPDEFKKVTPPAPKTLKQLALLRWPIKMRLWDRLGQW